MIGVYVIRRGVGPLQMARDGHDEDGRWFEGTLRQGLMIEVSDGAIMCGGFRSGRLGTWIIEGY
jgi:hypothetical protein